MASKKKGGDERQSGYSRLFDGLAYGASNLAGILVGKKRSCAGGLGLTRRGEKVWVATVRAYSESEHQWMVAFGNGADPVEALMAVNGAISRGSWHPDKYAKAELPDWKVVDLHEPVLPPGLVNRIVPPPEEKPPTLPKPVDEELQLAFESMVK